MIQDTPVRRASRNLKQPNHIEFDVHKWRSLLDRPNCSQSDYRLVDSAIWIATQLQTLRASIYKIDHSRLGGELSTILAIASLNREFHVGIEKHRRATRPNKQQKNSFLAMDEILKRPLPGGLNEQSISLDDAMDAAGDSVEAWLYDATKVPSKPSSSVNKNDYDSIIRIGSRYYSLQKGLSNFWQQALWEDWGLKDTGTNLTWIPFNENLALLFYAWHARNWSNAMSAPFSLIASWKRLTVIDRRNASLSKTVTHIIKCSGKKRQFAIGRPVVSDYPPHYALDYDTLQNSYLSDFLNINLPKYPDLTCSFLLRAWHVLCCLADSLAQDLKQPKFGDKKTLQAWALMITREEILATLIRSLDCSETVAQTIIFFFSWGPNIYKGVWGAPIVPVPNKNTFCLARSILSAGNVIRSVEIWLYKGGVTDDSGMKSKGDIYEDNLRQKIKSAIERNPLLGESRCAKVGVKKTNIFPEQIDLLIQIGSLLIVGEVKCFLFPADSRERFNYMKKVSAAAKQARRKSNEVEKNRQIITEYLNIPPNRARELKIIPLVVLNQGFGISYEIDGCILTDSRFLHLYLSSGSYYSDALMDPSQGTFAPTTKYLYHSQFTASENFEKIFKNPPPLSRFIERLNWEYFSFPTMNGNNLLCANAIIRDIPQSERNRIEKFGKKIGILHS